MKKNVIRGSVAALALMCAAPALAQTSGSVNAGAGTVFGAGGFTNGSFDTSTLSGSNNQTISIDIDREISSSSGSGFGGTINVNSLPNDSSYALMGGIGASGSSINANVDAANNGLISTSSFNAGLYGGLTGGNAALTMQVVNFGQSSADFKLTTAFDAEYQDEFQTSSTDWTMAGAAGVGAFSFGSLGWDVN